MRIDVPANSGCLPGAEGTTASFFAKRERDLQGRPPTPLLYKYLKEQINGGTHQQATFCKRG